MSPSTQPTVMPSTITPLPTTTLPPSTQPADTTTMATTTTAVAATSTTTAATVPVGAEEARLLAGQRVLCTFNGTTVPDDVLLAVSRGDAAGVLLFRENLVSAEQSGAVTGAIQAAAASSPAGIPAIVAVDQEGGIVARIPGPPSKSAAVMGTWSSDDIRAEGRATAENLASWGVNVDLAPVADVARSGTFEDRQHRSFGADPDRVAAAVAAFVDGLHDGGVAATLKHFPGLGSVEVTTDTAPAEVTLGADVLAATDRPPFAAGIVAGVDLVMMSSAVYTAYSDVPAVMSSAVVDELRTGLAFGGVVVSDALDTPALDAYGTIGERAVRAAEAGVDLFIASTPTACGEMSAAIAAAILDGTLAPDQARAAADRVAALRQTLGQ